MYIISKKKDYYDGVVGTMGMDKTIVYDRNTVIVVENDKGDVEFPKEFLPCKYGTWGRDENSFSCLSKFEMLKTSHYHAYSTFIIGFCGKLYVGWKFYTEVTYTTGEKKLLTDIVYNFNTVKNHIKNKGWTMNLDVQLKACLNYDAIEIFRKYHTPIFVIDYDYDKKYIRKYYEHPKVTFILNSNLNDLQFYKIFDSFAAFQEIQMFLSGVLGNKENDTITISDKDKITQHGFDKFSFRKEKEEK